MSPLAPLPIDDVMPRVIEALRDRAGAVVVAPPGAGKTTRIPPAIVRAAILAPPHDRIVMLQPRRVAARAAAARIAHEQGWRLGEEVGYHIRFDNRTTPRTRVRVLTEGILARQIQSDAFLEGVGCVILDEFHERSLHTDLALALVREVQATVRPDLRLLVMSATMDPAPVAAFLGDAPIIESAGRLHSVAIEFAAPDKRRIEERAAAAARAALGDSDAGHVLVFLPGMGEIRRTQDALGNVDADVHVLHSAVAAEEQDRALAPSARRKVILATNIAETSLTIDGVRTVIDSGLVRVALQDPRLGIDRLETRRVSRASADQRAGRAGRTAPGRCLRLWTKTEDATLEPRDVPEIHRVDLAATLLMLRAYGVRDLAAFRWFTMPAPHALERAESLLRLLGAIDRDGGLTQHGRELAALPLHPRMGCLLLAGAQAGLAEEAAWVAAVLSEGETPRSHSGSGMVVTDSDVLDLAEDVARTGLRSRVARVQKDLARLVAEQRGTAPPTDRRAALRRALLDGWPDRVTLRRAGADGSKGVMVGGRGVVLDLECGVRQSVLFLSLDPRETDRTGAESRVRLASAIEEAWLREDFPHLMEERERHVYDAARGKVETRREVAFAGLVIDQRVTGSPSDPDGVARALAEGLMPEVESLLAADEELTTFVNRWRLVQHALKEENLPTPDAETLQRALESACAGCRNRSEVVGARLRQAVENALDHAQRRLVEREGPATIEVPSGSRIRLQYQGDPAAPPVLAVRLQEVFGLRETPRLARGRVAVVMHLLAPNHRPVQITTDLANFWKTTYAEVRKELRARYPKHPWPEDPTSAPPVAVGRRRRPS